MLKKSTSESFICERLLDMMEDTQLHKIKVTEFVVFAEISRSTFYLYFNSIYDVIQKIEDDFIGGMIKEDEPVTLDFSSLKSTEPSASTIAKAEYVRNNIRTLRILMGENGDPSFQPRVINRTRRLYQKHFANSKRSDIEKQMIFEYLANGQWGLFKWWTLHKDTTSVYKMASMLEELSLQIFRLI